MNNDSNQNVINNIRSLGIDMIDKAGSGHPGIVLGAAPIMYALFANNFIYSATDTRWINRDRFVMSAGHGSALLYATLYMMGYLKLEDLQNFRSINSNTPGHPEYGMTPGIDASTGPLGQGIGMAVGMALGEKILNARYKTASKKSIFDYHVYALCGDGDLMEGISYEAASLAGTWKLNNLILLYDSNSISLDGPTSYSFTENVRGRFEALGWDTMFVKDGEDYKEISKAIQKARGNSKPTLIEVKTVIGLGSKDAGTNKVHGKPLEKSDIFHLKESYGFPQDPFYVIPNIPLYMQNIASNRNNKIYDDWSNVYREYLQTYNEDTLNFIYHKEEPFDLLKYEFNIPYDERISTRDFNKEIMQVISKQQNSFIGGSADLFSSTKDYIDEGNDLSANNYLGKNIWFGIREHSMAAILNGLALTGFKPYGSTFLSFADYLKPALRLSALMKLPVTYIFSHDSILIGSDGPTHQPVEQLSMLRNTPNMVVYRPADPNELIGCWNNVLKTDNHPSTIILSKNINNPMKVTDKTQVEKGAYIVHEYQKQMMGIIMATGTELYTAIRTSEILYRECGLDLRIVSMPSRELFEAQSEEYKKSLLPVGTRVCVIEYASSDAWYKYVYSDKYLITVNTFGKSGTKNQIEKEYQLDMEDIKTRIKDMFM
jgi:transketolase